MFDVQADAERAAGFLSALRLASRTSARAGRKRRTAGGAAHRRRDCRRGDFYLRRNERRAVAGIRGQVETECCGDAERTTAEGMNSGSGVWRRRRRIGRWFALFGVIAA